MIHTVRALFFRSPSRWKEGSTKVEPLITHTFKLVDDGLLEVMSYALVNFNIIVYRRGIWVKRGSIVGRIFITIVAFVRGGYEVS